MVSKTAVISPVNIEERQKIDVRAGDTVKVWQKIQEKGKTRLQLFEGLVLAVKHGKEAGATFTVRKVASGVGVEKIFPIYSPMIDKIEIVKRSKVRRAKLYHIREKAAKEIRRQTRNSTMMGVSTDDFKPEEVPDEEVAAEVAEDKTGKAGSPKEETNEEPKSDQTVSDLGSAKEAKAEDGSPEEETKE